jgi:hypothetical protein
MKLSGLFVTRRAICPKRFVPKRAFRPLRSEHGVRIGSTESEVEGKLGTPKRRDDVRAIEERAPYLKDNPRYSSVAGSYRIVYDDSPSSLLFNFYGLDAGEVVSIWLAERE